MKAFMLAAGYGERLRPLTNDLPKPLLPVGGVPSICYALMLLKEAGITEIVCNLHYRPQDIIDFFREHGNFGCDVSFSFEPEILGTGGGVKKCESLLREDFIVINSDIITDLPLANVLAAYRASGLPGLVVLHRQEAGEGGRVVSLAGDRVADFRNALGTNIPPTCDYLGVAVLSPRIMPYLSEEFSSIVYTGYTGLIRDHGLGWYMHEGLWIDIGTLESYREADATVRNNEELLRRVSAII